MKPTRRDVLKAGIAVTGLGTLALPDWALPVMAQGEVLVAFTDIPEGVRWEVPPDRRTLDIRTIDGPFTPAAKFATTQHYGHPDLNPADYKLKLTGLVDRPKSLSLDDLKKMGSGNDNPTAAKPAPSKSCVDQIHHRRVRKMSTTGLHSGLMTQGR